MGLDEYADTRAKLMQHSPLVAPLPNSHNTHTHRHATTRAGHAAAGLSSRPLQQDCFLTAHFSMHHLEALQPRVKRTQSNTLLLPPKSATLSCKTEKNSCRQHTLAVTQNHTHGPLRCSSVDPTIHTVTTQTRVCGGAGPPSLSLCFCALLSSLWA
mmetsp:Transcript_29024/g.72374  ORF Transcript_29024/g.72374 Transcript_29024/m.72374 type:complete len:156 (+) Transcript_29024:486-953(+)